MFGSILSVISGLLGFASGPLKEITNKIVDYKMKLVEAETDKEKMELQEHITTLEAQRDVLISENKPDASHINAFIRMGFALPVILYIWQVLAYDKVISVWITGQSHTTDDLSANLWNLVWIVIGFYFLTVIGTRIFKR